MKKYLLLVVVYHFFGWCIAQSFGNSKHFSHDVKLTQSRILDIQQDEKGFIWLGTFNGLIRYDGTVFKNFEVGDRGALKLMSNRVSKFKLDKDGRLWIKSEKDEVYYFDKQQLKYHYPLENPKTKFPSVPIKQFKIVASGRVWLIPEVSNTIYVFERDKQIKRFPFSNTKLKGAKVHDVFEDSTGTTWVLTNMGLCRLKAKAVTPEYFLYNAVTPSGEAYSFNAVYESKEYIWFGATKGRLVRYHKKTATFFESLLAITDTILQMEEMVGGKLLLVTSGSSFYCYDIKTAKLETYNSQTMAGFPKENIKYVGITRSRQFWFEADRGGLYQFDLISKKLSLMVGKSTKPRVVGVVPKTFMLTAPNGSIWIQSKNTPFSFWDENKNRLVSVANFFDPSDETVSDIMHTATFDAVGNLWFCSFKQGVDLLVFNNNYFSNFKLSASADGQKNNVRSLMKDRKGNLWVASRSQKIELFNSKNEKIGILGSDGTLSASSPGWGADIYSMLEDTKGRIWIGTRGNGLFCLLPNGRPFNYKVLHYNMNERDRYSISCNDVYKIFQASNGQIYLATWGGGVNFLKEDKGNFYFINHNNEFKNYPIKMAPKVRSIVESKDRKLFFISSNKLFSFSNDKSLKDIKFTEYSYLFGSDILDIMVTTDNSLALATNGKGLFMAHLDKKGALKVQSFEDKFLGSVIGGVVALQEDSQHNIWLVGDDRIVRFIPKKNTIETFPELKSIIGNEIFSEATKSQLANGDFVIGYSNGLVRFNPLKIKSSQFKPYLAITGFEVNNKELHLLNPETPANPDLLREIDLEHDQNFFRVQFSALDYFKTENIAYRYKLIGVDKEWNYIKGSESINYTNLGKGTYELIISSTNDHNIWVDNERRIKIKIHPSIWASNLAYFVYVILIFAIFYLAIRVFVTILKLRNDVQLQKQMGDLKLKFFTDISHEIRTPLTMITAPVEKMLLDENLSESTKSQLQLIERNSNRLLHLVNQILDLRKIQNRKLEIRPINLKEFVSKACLNFTELGLQRKIQLEVVSNADNPTVWADVDGLDKILINLISNAIKYCREGDTIRVIVKETEKRIQLKVKDNGPGIHPNIQKKLFQRFSNYNDNPNNPSTGIGLSIVKDLVEQHGAKISVDTDSGGSCFKIAFLKGYEHFGDDVDVLFEQDEIEKTDANVEVEEFKEENAEILTNKKPKGLIVEDDAELRGFIASILEPEYEIHVAENGLEGQLKAASILPDFIISDIMMPQVDGIEMLKMIRANIVTSHIPVILLSAKTAIETKLEGMEYGADEYMSKPFNVSFLKARVKNVLDQRKRLQLLYSSGAIMDVVPQNEVLSISNQDHKFMVRVVQLVKENLSNPDFSVEELGKLMSMSRASFFNKLKQLTGVSPVVYIRDMRLNEAAERIKNDDLLIKEICFEVGFNDLKYFGKCFKEKFNYTPADYRKQFR